MSERHVGIYSGINFIVMGITQRNKRTLLGPQMCPSGHHLQVFKVLKLVRAIKFLRLSLQLGMSVKTPNLMEGT